MSQSLLAEVIHATGLPFDLVQEELTIRIQASGRDIDRLTIDDFREVLADYLKDVLLEAKESFALEEAFIEEE